uniref:Uncharacterized protein n=1 Tax=Brassica oleracea var. oleracea TaxID=109376 RepID=A0A0D3AH94_BRAOL
MHHHAVKVMKQGGNYVLVRLILMQNQSLLVLIQWTWKMMRWRCFLKLGLNWLTLGERRLKEKLEK